VRKRVSGPDLGCGCQYPDCHKVGGQRATCGTPTSNPLRRCVRQTPTYRSPSLSKAANFHISLHLPCALTRIMASATLIQWPSLVWERFQAETVANQNPEHAHTPPWSAQAHSLDNVITAPLQPNPCLQLTQVLEWELWNHEQTRANLQQEQTHCARLQGYIWKLERDITQWQASCETVYAALNEHRAEHAALQRDFDGVLAEVEEFRRKQPETKVSSCEYNTKIYIDFFVR
jgi:hypothetical protein